MLRLRPGFDREVGEAWQDDDDGKLETKIASIAAAIIVAGEVKFRKGLREAEERAEQQRLEQEKRRQEQLVNRQRLQNLHTSVELLRQAEKIRALVERVQRAITEGSLDIDAATLSTWERWALAEADKIDPIRSGQVMTHLNVPRL
ncbi:hypothetical protein NTH_01489 [Nitratireductor thuwali]|uniref:Uncharacterized protein n=2 Tax=Nitratireductor thuwali TaxID=2267699 RepID=A0ABY5MK44_9HYPH|nr:hypothetical protein NTH_01489 [Nitratireductor thuwali]